VVTWAEVGLGEGRSTLAGSTRDADDHMVLIDEGLELLTEEECLDRLAPGGVGRVGVTIGGLPVILPVNYAFVDGEVLFRTGEGTKLSAATQRAVVAFEVDAYDADSASGWSVLIIGRSSVVTDPIELARLDGYEITTWADGTRNNYVRLRPELISGRRIESG
jgi:uncharacterized protein